MIFGNTHADSGPESMAYFYWAIPFKAKMLGKKRFTIDGNMKR